MKIPFDSLTLAAVVHEMQPFVGSKVQRISQPSDSELVLEIYGTSGAAWILLSVHPEFARIHFSTHKPENPMSPPQFCSALRARISGARITGILQVGFDRIFEIHFEGEQGQFRLVAEIMGKHSNLMVLDSSQHVVAAIKWVGKSKSKRPIVPGVGYTRPPTGSSESLLDAESADDLKGKQGASPFLLRWIYAAGAEGLAAVKRSVLSGNYRPELARGSGAYPVSLSPLGITGLPRPTISLALEQHFDAAIPAARMESLRASLRTQLSRVALARDTAIHELEQSVAAGQGASRQQMKGELILAYGFQAESGASQITAEDYEGNRITIPIDPELTIQENAQQHFDRAKRAKARLGFSKDQLSRLATDREAIEGFLVRLESATHLQEILDLQDEAKQRKWLNKPPPPKATKEERPYEGHRVRELLAPGGYTVLYAENAESNDYLTLRVAKPNDWWLHVRGSTSAHVIIQTRNQPDKVQRETLQFAAKVAVQNSPSKHAGYVPVDYTLKKYVRKPKGAPKGTAFYTHEKTLHVDS
ncbi:MAG TPA: NFACT family protein [Fimbriimonadaceae bacterium]|nr:NFACT family protein [Fimbriimonadaceae bacterium]